jgi:EmrB/QacA subfamily drug resistance transporter
VQNPAGNSPTIRPTEDSRDPLRWRALAVLALVQFTLVLDLTVVNIALPHIQHDLKFRPSDLAWVVNAYTLTAGGLLLLGGRMGDLLGRRRVFLVGLAVFALASICCGAALSPSMLVTGRFVQGVGEALASPAGLAIVAVMFTDPTERSKAIGLWVGLAAIGGTLGIVLSGVINDLTTWRWIFYINVPVALAALLLVPRLVRESRASGHTRAGRPDFAGALTATLGMVALVYGLLEAAQRPWSSPTVAVPIIGGAVLLVTFIVVERVATVPLIPLDFFANRTRTVATVVNVLFASGFYANAFLLTLYMQNVLHWSPLKTGLAYLPYGLLIIVGGGAASVLMPRVGARPLLAVGSAVAGVGLLLLSTISVPGSYVSDIMPGSLLLGIGAGLCFPTVGNASLHETSGENSGLASGVRNTSYQLGGAMGIAVLVTVALQHTRAAQAAGSAALVATTAGYALALRVAAGVLIAGAVLVALAMQSGVGTRPAPEMANAN